MNAVDPVFDMPLFEGAFAAGADYLDMAMSLSRPHPEAPYERVGVKLGDEQFARDAAWEEAGRLALVGIGVEPGLSDVFARYAADHLFAEIDELGTRDGANLVVTDDDGNEVFAPSFSMWTTIEECLNPPVIWERDRADVDGGWFTTRAVLRAGGLRLPRGHRPGGVRERRARGGAADAAMGRREAGDVQVRPRRGVHRHPQGAAHARPRQHREGPGQGQDGYCEVSPRDVVAACLPDPATIGPRMTGKTCAGLWVRGTGTDGEPRSTYLFHVVDNEWSMREYGHQCVVWQTAVNPVIALELLARGTWKGTGVRGPEAFDAVPFLDLLTEYGSPWGMQEVPA